MILKKVNIKNFRSIKNEFLDFTVDKCKILVGINEAGKSNVLKALNCYKQDYGSENIRRPKSGEEIDDYIISYFFELAEEEKNNIYSALSKEFYNVDSKYFKIKDKNQISLKELIDLIEINVFRTSDSKTTYSTNLREFSFNDNVEYGLFKSDKSAQDLPDCYSPTHKYFDNKINTDFYDEKDLNIEVFIKKIENFIQDYVIKQREKVVFWEYKEENILPSEINYQQFLTNPEINKTLKALFEICGKENWNNDILKRIADRSHVNSYIDNAYSKKILQYFKDKWPELKLKGFRIYVDGEMLRFSFIDEEDNEYNTKERSDGFKRFITFLILISGKSAIGDIRDTILIVDEPDIAIHILGQRYLLRELLNISENNIVIFSTHSPFMIDKTNIGRHYIVKKENEVTELTISSESNFSEEEVLFQALGYSVFCNLKAKNILFEGYWDNVVFKLFKDDHFSFVGNIYIGGLKNAQSVAKTIELQEKEFVVISDSDTPAKESKKEFEKLYKGLWTEYGSLSHGVYTLEDFVSNLKIKEALQKLISLKAYSKLEQLDTSFIDTLQFKKLDVIISKCTQVDNNLNKKEFQRVLKEKIYHNIKTGDISDSYNDVLNYILSLQN